MPEFLDVMWKIVKKWSQDRNELISKDVMIFKLAPIDTYLWTLSFKFAQKNLSIHRIENSYYFNYDSDTKVTLCKITAYNKAVELNKCTSFSDYSEITKLICKVVINTDSWRQSHCKCKYFHKEYICMHIIGLAIRLGLVTAPTEAINIDLVKKKPRGAQKKAKAGHALIID